MDADHHVSCDKELRWNVNAEPSFVQDRGVDTGSRKTGRKYKSFREFSQKQIQKANKPSIHKRLAAYRAMMPKKSKDKVKNRHQEQSR